MKDLLPWLLMTALTISWMLDRSQRAAEPEPPAQAVVAATPPGAAHQLADLVVQLESSERSYLTFLEKPTLRTGLYALPAGSVDQQRSYDEDAVYYIAKGHSGMTIDGNAHTVAPGDAFFVAANAEHRFHTLEEEVQVLVFFAAAEPEATKDRE